MRSKHQVLYLLIGFTLLLMFDLIPFLVSESGFNIQDVNVLLSTFSTKGIGRTSPIIITILDSMFLSLIIQKTWNCDYRAILRYESIHNYTIQFIYYLLAIGLCFSLLSVLEITLVRALNQGFSFLIIGYYKELILYLVSYYFFILIFVFVLYLFKSLTNHPLVAYLVFIVLNFFLSPFMVTFIDLVPDFGYVSIVQLVLEMITLIIVITIYYTTLKKVDWK